QTLVEPQEFYDEHEVDLLLGNEVTAVDTRREAVSLSEGGRLGYRKLLLATGAIPRTLDVAGADLPGVFALRSLEDAPAIREAADRALVECQLPGGGGRQGARRRRRRVRHGVDLLHRILRSHAEGLRRRLAARRPGRSRVLRPW